MGEAKGKVKSVGVMSFCEEFIDWCEAKGIDPFPMATKDLKRLYREFEDEYDRLSDAEKRDWSIHIRVRHFSQMSH